jgi:allophanate hydrolase
MNHYTLRFPPFDLAGLRRDYAAGRSVAEVLQEVFRRIELRGEDHAWIHRPALDELLKLAPSDRSLPLFGLPFAVKDNIDVAGWPTTAACPAFSYVATADAPVVARLRAAGAIPIGKTNLDQFATGLVGTRSPHGACRSVFHEDYISGGSSSGSAVAVASGEVAFSLGTDTAGSGRVPAAFNGLVGLKPTPGLLSTRGVVPACRSLDCVSIFANGVADASAILAVAQGFDGEDPFSRRKPSMDSLWPAHPRIGLLPESQREFFRDSESPRLYAKAIARCAALGFEIIEIDYGPFREAAKLLYAGPRVAERLAAVGEFLAANPDAFHPVTRGIIERAAKWTAAEAYRAGYELERLRRLAEHEWGKMDALLLPTAPSPHRVADVLADPLTLNSQLGTYTNFVNLLDCAALAVPAGVGDSGLPFGVTFIGRAWSDALLTHLGACFVGETPATPPTGTLLAVVGAHLSGQPLNHQLTTRGARLRRTCRTAPGYRLYRLPSTMPPKPGLRRAPGFAGPGIELEVWELTARAFGEFVAEVPAPMGIGNVELEDGAVVKGFLCEAFALEGAEEITAHGGWRAYLAALR